MAEKSSYKASVNNNITFDAVDTDALDFVVSDDGNFHILYQEKAFRAELIHADYLEKKFSIKVNGSVYEIALADKYDQLVTSLGLQVNNTQAVAEIIAPMPGLVLAINVEPNDQIKKGDPILILEAMKMENIIKSPGEAVVDKILVKQGDAVEKGQVLVKFQ